MFLFIVTHLGCDTNAIANILNSTKRCQQRSVHGKYHNMIDVLDMKSRLYAPVLYDFTFHNFQLTHKNLKVVKYLIVPCRPDLAQGGISYFFNRLLRMREIKQDCPHSLVVPYEDFNNYLSEIKTFLELNRIPEGSLSIPPFQDNPAMTRYKEVKKVLLRD